jgi:FkbM family methyltransferase
MWETKFRGFSELLAFDNWPLLVLHRLFFRSQPLVVYRKKGRDFLIDYAGGDHCGTRACIATDMYRRYFSALPQNKPLRVLDIGANGGGFPLSLALAGFNFERVVCVEMNPATFGRLKFNVESNFAPAAVCLNAAVYSSDGHLDAPLGGAGGSGYSLHHAPDGTRPMVRIDTFTFDTLAAKYFADAPIDICKMDIEGAEYEVLLSGAAQHLARCRHLIIEIHPHAQHSFADLHSFLKRQGFATRDTVTDAEGVYFYTREALLS